MKNPIYLYLSFKFVSQMFNTRLLLIAIVIVLIPTTVSAITVQGTVYEWSTFEPLDDALVEEFPDEDIGNVTYDVEDNILPGLT